MKSKCQEVADRGMGDAPRCITEHPGFNAVCLDVWNLQAVYYEYKQHYGQMEKPLQELVCFYIMSKLLLVTKYRVRQKTSPYAKCVISAMMKYNIKKKFRLLWSFYSKIPQNVYFCHITSFFSPYI
jgi:hypothetical protein